MVMDPEQLRAAGDWIVQLRKILQLGPRQQRDFGDRPDEKHRSTKKAVELLLSNLRKGNAKQQDNDTTDEDIRMVVFNTVDLLIDDKLEKTKTKKTRLEALEKFQTVLVEQFKAEAKKKNDVLDNEWKLKIEEAVRALRQEELEKVFLAGSDDPNELEAMRQEMLTTEEGKNSLAKKPDLAGKVLSSVDPKFLANIDLDTVFGNAKDDVVAAALVAVTEKKKAKDGNNIDRASEFDPELFKLFATKVKPEVYNDQTTTSGARKGLGPRVCNGLWQLGQYDSIADLIHHGVDTSLATRVEEGQGSGGGVYSGFIQPIQHLTSKMLNQIPVLEKIQENEKNPKPNQKKETVAPWTTKSQVEGVKKILKALDEEDVAVTLTSWKEVVESEMVQEFANNPGTIWGFEDVRLPFVQAAHQNNEDGKQPLRMMELWEAIELVLTPDAYDELLATPEVAVEKLVKKGVEEVTKGFKSTEIKKQLKYRDLKEKQTEYLKQFEIDARSFLLDFAKQMPKGTYRRAALDDEGKPIPLMTTDGKQQQVDQSNQELLNVGVADVAGIIPGKFMGGLACKAGLWWAKNEGKPVYYCLDGINMADVTNYKKVKNKAIEDFIAAGGQEGGAKGHDEVITLVELREILKNWADFKDTVKFVLKGKIIKGEELEKQIKQWKDDLDNGNQQAGRTPAPPRDKFANELNDFDPNLLDKLDDGKEGDMDARDIVKKSGYLLKVAKTRPQLVLKYVISRCSVLIKYDLISKGLPDAGSKLVTSKEEEAIKKAGTAVLKEIKNCHTKFRPPLKSSLARHPLIKDDENI